MHLLSKSFHMMAIMMRRKVISCFRVDDNNKGGDNDNSAVMMMRMMGFGKYQQNGQPRSARSERDWNTEKHKTFHKESTA